MNTLYRLLLSIYIEDKHEYIISFIIIQRPVTQNGRPGIPIVYDYKNSQIQLRSWQLELPGQVRSFDHPEFPCQVKVWQPELPCQIEALTTRTPRSGKSFDYPDSHLGQSFDNLNSQIKYKFWLPELLGQGKASTTWTPMSGKSFDFLNS